MLKKLEVKIALRVKIHSHSEKWANNLLMAHFSLIKSEFRLLKAFFTTNFF